MAESALSHVIYYRVKSDKLFNIILIVLLLWIAAMSFISGDDAYHYSMFIGHPQDLPLPLNEWSLSCTRPDHFKTFTIFYLVLDFFFPIILSLVLVFLLKGVSTSEIDKESYCREFKFVIRPFKSNSIARFSLYLLIVATLTDWVENYLVYDFLLGTKPFLTSHGIYEIIQNIKLFLFAVPCVLILGLFIYTYIHDFYRLWKKYFKYFYPSIIGVGFTLLVFSFFGQVDDFIISLVKYGNLSLFLLLFLLGMIGLWAIPNYLRYTKELDGLKNLKFPKILKYSFFPVPSNNKDSQSSQFTQKAIADRFKEYKPKERDFFDSTRRAIAIVFILIFLMAQLDLLTEICVDFNGLKPLVLMINVLCIIAITYFYRKSRREDFNAVEKEGPKAKILTDERFNNKSKLFRLSKPLFLIAVINFAIAGFHITYCFYTDMWSDQTDLISKLIIYASHTFLFSLSFLVYSIYRQIELDPDDYGVVINKKIYSLINNISYTPTLIRWFFISSTIAFVYVLIILFINSHLIELLNPVNLFLIILNFFIALIAFLDRVIYLSIQSNQVNKSRVLGGVFVAFVLLIIGIGSRSNSYHELSQKAYTLNNELEYLDLEEYTNQFLADHSGDKVYFIAADGGGLKAAYWTMNVLHKLQEEDSSFFNNVFLTTGASGGMVGLGMYTYMQGQNMSNDQIRNKIDSLGSTNFLNNDLAGLAIKTPIVKLMPFLEHLISDRTAAMSHRYFQLTSENIDIQTILEKPFGYLWTKRNYKDLPLLLVNTTKTEDGSKGIIHPLSVEKGSTLFSAFTDLTDYNYKDEELTNINSLSLPDGLFTTNRFPIFSPYARVEGKGHFVDGGYLENSGLSTVYHILDYMRLNKDSSNAFNDLIDSSEIVVISIGNDRTSHVKNVLADQEINKTNFAGELTAIISAAAGGGLTALPEYYDYLFESLENPVNSCCTNLKFHKIDLPFLFDIGSINRVYKGQIERCDLRDIAYNESKYVLEKLTKNDCTICKRDKFIHSPRLGRYMSEPALNYMNDMINHPDVTDVIQNAIN